MIYNNHKVNSLKEFRCLSISSNIEILNEQIQFLLDERYIPIIKPIDNNYAILIKCNELEFDAIRYNMPKNQTMPYKNNIEIIEKTEVYSINVPGVDLK